MENLIIRKPLINNEFWIVNRMGEYVNVIYSSEFGDELSIEYEYDKKASDEEVVAWLILEMGKEGGVAEPGGGWGF